VFVINIEQAWAQYFTHTSGSCVHAARCGSNLVMEPDGQLYACDHLINDRHHLGQLDDRRWLRRWTRGATALRQRKKPTPRMPAVRGKNGLPGRLPGAS
jgi:hypothetical protein